jgi:hypothetical protein
MPYECKFCVFKSSDNWALAKHKKVCFFFHMFRHDLVKKYCNAPNISTFGLLRDVKGSDFLFKLSALCKDVKR